MQLKRYVISVVFFLCVIPFQRVAAQEIKGDSIYTSAVSVVLEFPERIVSYAFSDTGGDRRFRAIVIGSSIALRAKIEKPKPATILISEGSRNHSFVLVFNKNLSVGDLVHQWPDTAALEKYVAKLAAKKAAAMLADTTVKRIPLLSQKKLDSLAQIKRNNKYDSVISKAAEAFAIQDFAGSKKYAAEAHSLKPLEVLPVSLLANVESAIRNAAMRQRYDDSIKLVIRTRETIEKADKQILHKNWNNALALYRQVLALQPTPVQADYAQKKIEAINFEFQRIDSLAATQANVTPVVNTEKKQEPTEQTAIATVSDQSKEKPIVQENVARRKLEISNWMDKAQQAFAAKNWDSAKAYYKYAISLYPSREKELFARKKIEEINLKLANGTNDSVNVPMQNTAGTTAAVPNSATLLIADSTSEMTIAENLKIAEANKLSIQVDELMISAQKAIMAKKWDSAKAYYLQVIALSPLDTREEFAKKKIDVIDFEIAKIAPAAPPARETPAAHRLDTVKIPLQKATANVAKETPAAHPVDTAKVPLQKAAANVAKETPAAHREDTVKVPLQKAVPNTTTDSGTTNAKNTTSDAVEKTAKELAAIRDEQERIFQRKLQISEWMDKGQQAFAMKQWDSAKAFYKNAIALYPSREREAFARKKIEDIDTEIENAAAQADAVKEGKDTINPNTPVAPQQPAAAESNTKTVDNKLEEVVVKPAKEPVDKMVKDTFMATQKTIKPDTLQRGVNGEVTKDTLPATQPKNKVPAAEKISPADAEVLKSSRTSSDISKINKSILPASKNLAANTVKGKIIPTGQEHVASHSTPVVVDTILKIQKEYHEVSALFLTQKPRISFADSTNSVRLICQDISFKGSDAYIKFLMQNNSSTSQFDTDSLQVTYIKNYGILKKLKPHYLSNVPDVQPGKEAQIVFVAVAPADVEANEIFIVEVEDKLKKSKLTIHIPGDVYNRLKAY